MRFSASMRAAVAAAVTLACLGATACTSSSGSSGSSAQSGQSGRSGSSNSPATVDVVASTNVWGNIAAAVGGDHVSVTSIVASANQDPHGYSVTASDKLAATKAKVAVVNGGGYDDWASEILKGTHATVIDAVAVSGFDADAPQFNEHVFYSLDTVEKVAEKIAESLASADTAHAGDYSKNADEFVSKIHTLTAAVNAIGAGHPGLTALLTEPVAGYLITSAGIQNVTPAEFTVQSETDAGPSAKVLSDTTGLLTSHTAKILVTNAQTEDDVSHTLETAATSAGVPIVKAYELLPDGSTYIGMITQVISDLAAAAKQVA